MSEPHAASIAAARAVLDGFMTALNAEDAEAIRTRWYHFPYAKFHSGTISVIERPEDFKLVLSRGAGSDWARSALDAVDVVEAGANKVHFNIRFTRYRTDGAAISTFGSLYIVTLKDGRWAIQGQSSWAP